jgi:hypothetical protein
MAAGSIAALVQVVLQGMMMSRWLKTWSLVLLVATAGSGAGILAMQGDGQDRGRAGATGTGELPSVTVKSGKLHAVVSEPGVVTTARSFTKTSVLPGESVIKWIVPDRSVVKKGELVGQFDSETLENQLRKQLQIAQAAEAAFQAARLTRETTELAAVEYTNGILVQDRMTVQRTIDIAAADAMKAEGRLARTRRVSQRIREAIDLKKNMATPADILAEFEIEDLVQAAEEDLRHKRLSLTQAKAALERLETTTRPKMIKDLKAEVERARSDELAKLATWKLEKSKADSLRRQIESCNLHAPADGVLLHANDTRISRLLGSPHDNRPSIANGATVRQRQIIFTMSDLESPLRVVTRVPAWSIGRVKRDVKARLKIDGIPDRVLTGKVTEVPSLPDPRSVFANRDVYTISLRVDDPPAALVPEMPAQVEIDVADLDNVLSVPKSAVRTRSGRDHLAVKKPGGGFEWREVTLGMSSATSVEVKSGIKDGEQIVLDPSSMPGPVGR